MDPKRIDGKAMANQVQEELKMDIAALKERGVTPGLAVVIVGDREDSRAYVRMKKQAAEQLGIHFVLRELPVDIVRESLLEEVEKLNRTPEIHGLIVQLPLPSHIDEKEILDSVSYEKDVDGFHPLNIGALCMKGRQPLFTPCTPMGCMQVMERAGVELSGKNVVVLGRSNIVGIPVAMMCLHRNATVQICHSQTVDIEAKCSQADVVIAAVGKPEMVRKSWIKPGAVVIDVGINSIPDPSRKSGQRLVGDVAYEEVKEVASLITPVPGGIGPMTVAMLMRSTVEGAKRVAPKQ